MSAEPAADAAHDQAAAPCTHARPAWLRALPIVVLLLAIGAQATLMNTVNADRQAGSGFAMFSSVDFAGSRAVVVTAVYNGDEIPVRLPQSVDDQLDELLRAPTDTRAGKLAQDLDSLAWTLEDDRIVPDPDGSDLESVSVTVRGLTADGRRLSSQVLAQAMTP